jgi:hypothetical protein
MNLPAQRPGGTRGRETSGMSRFTYAFCLDARRMASKGRIGWHARRLGCLMMLCVFWGYGKFIGDEDGQFLGQFCSRKFEFNSSTGGLSR